VPEKLTSGRCSEYERRKKRASNTKTPLLIRHLLLQTRERVKHRVCP
jgi:hypothetical protein